MRWNRKDGWRPRSVSNRSTTKWLGWPRQKAVSRLLENFLEQHWLTGGLKVWLDLISHM